jgi:ketosteroid isomerase-like protein
MSPRKHLVETYFEGFRQSNHETILACLTDDVVWDLPGFKHSKARTRSTARSRTTHSRAARRSTSTA